MNDIAKTEKTQMIAGARVAPIIPTTVAEVAMVASAIIGGNLVPKSYVGKSDDETKSRVMLGVMKAAEVGLPPITGINTIAIINGRPSIWGDGAMALVHDSGQLDWSKETLEGTEPTGPVHEWPEDLTAVCVMKRKGNDEPVTRRFSVGDAKRAGMWGNPKRAPWINYPKRMLAARARSWCVRDLFADCLSGLSIAEEQHDMPMKDVTPPDTSYLDAGAPALAAPDESPVSSAVDAREAIDAVEVEFTSGEIVTGQPVAPETEAEVPFDDDETTAPLYLPENPTKKEALEWHAEALRAVHAAPDYDALAALNCKWQTGLAYLLGQYPESGQELQAAIDERMVELDRDAPA